MLLISLGYEVLGMISFCKPRVCILTAYWEGSP